MRFYHLLHDDSFELISCSIRFLTVWSGVFQMPVKSGNLDEIYSTIFENHCLHYDNNS